MLAEGAGKRAAVDRQVVAALRAQRLCSVPRRKRLLGQTDGPELHSAMGLLPGDLPFDCGARTERHGNELADEPVAGVDAVQPRLIGSAT